MIIIFVTAGKDYNESWSDADFKYAAQQAKKLKCTISEFRMDDGNYLVLHRGIDKDMYEIWETYWDAISIVDDKIIAKDKKDLIQKLKKIRKENE